MTHQYNTRTNKGDFQDALASIEQNITNSINWIKTDINSIKSDISLVKTDLKDLINNLKVVILKDYKMNFEGTVQQIRTETSSI